MFDLLDTPSVPKLAPSHVINLQVGTDILDMPLSYINSIKIHIYIYVLKLTYQMIRSLYSLVSQIRSCVLNFVLKLSDLYVTLIFLIAPSQLYCALSTKSKNRTHTHTNTHTANVTNVVSCAV